MTSCSINVLLAAGCWWPCPSTLHAPPPWPPPTWPRRNISSFLSFFMAMIFPVARSRTMRTWTSAYRRGEVKG
jgi:hypothetical protein